MGNTKHTHKMHKLNLVYLDLTIHNGKRQAHPRGALAESRPKGGYSASIYIYIYILAEYPPFGRDSANAPRGCAWRFPLWIVRSK